MIYCLYRESAWIKDELVKVKERAQVTLIKLQTLCELVGDGFFNVTQCFQDLLSVYRKCRDLEKILKSSFFEDPDIVKLVAEVKEALRTERTSRVLQNVMRHVNRVPSHRSTPKDKIQGVDSAGRTLANHVPHIDDAPLDCTRGACEGNVSGTCGADAAVESNTKTCAFQETTAPDSVERSLAKASLPNGPVAMDSSRSTSTVDLECNGIEVVDCDGKLEGSDLSTDTICTNLSNAILEEDSPSSANRDLCLRLCRLLNEKMLAIHLEASKRWAEAKQNKIDSDNKDANPNVSDGDYSESGCLKSPSDNAASTAVGDSDDLDSVVKETSNSSSECADDVEKSAENFTEGMKDKIISKLLDSIEDSVSLCDSPKPDELEVSDIECAEAESKGECFLIVIPRFHRNGVY